MSMKFGKILTFSWFCCKIRSKQLNIFPLFSDKRQRWPPLSQAGWCLFFSLQAVLPWFSTSGRRERCYVFFCLCHVFVLFYVGLERQFFFIFGFIRPWSMYFQQQSADFLFGVVVSFCLCHVFFCWKLCHQVNKSLLEDIERANADLRIAVDASADCS